MILVSVLAIAQSATMLSMARAELDKRGLTEMEVRERLMQDGINPDTISPSDYPKYQGRVMAILDQMQAEKAGASSTPVTSVASSTAVTVSPTGEVSLPEPEAAAPAATGVEVPTFSPEDIPQTTMGEAAAEAALEESLKENNVSSTEGNNIYGHSLFTGKSLDVFRTTDGAQAPDTYILGEGDEVHISIFGSSQTEIHQRISADGSIQPAGSTKIFLKGLTLAQGRTAIRSKLSQHYSFRPDQIAVTITTARTITVSIFGEVGIQGGFTLSALNTAFNALVAAGGPSSIGSVRNIQRTRAGKTSRLDFYAYITNPVTGIYFDLQNNDIIFVPVAQKIVSIEGAVKRPMRYEMIDGETLVDLINYAGGLTEDAYPNFVQIERYEDGEKKLHEYDLRGIMSRQQKISLEPGDIVRIRPSNRPMENYVSIAGDVYYEGSYDLEKNHSLKALIDNAKPRYTAKTDYVFVERTRPDETVEVLTVPFPGVNGNPDFLLQARDAVRVLEQSSYRDVATISVNGQVREPFSRAFGLNDRMTIGQAIELAGGLRPSVYPVAYISRQDLTNPERVSYIRVDLKADADQFLQPGDALNVYDNTTYTDVGEVHVGGAVKNPFGTTYDSSLTVHDLLVMAGGFSVGAAYDRIQVFRLNISRTDEPTYDVLTISVDDDYNVTSGDFQLQPYDHIVVRMTPNFGLSRTVQINGRVRFPGEYVIEDRRMHLSELISMAGGLLDDADPYVRIVRAYNNRGPIGVNLDDAIRSHGNLSSDPVLMEGDIVDIVRQENTVTIRETGTRMAQYVPQSFPSSQKSIVYQGGHNARWYINHYAGGFTKTADRNSVTVTLPNNQSESTTHFLFFRVYPKVMPGSVISLRTDPEKEKKLVEPKEKVDWDNVFGRVLTTITSVSTVILLIERLK